jgi:GrpB-like predicted nucleotidyltransferase (UPF0157 family)
MITRVAIAGSRHRLGRCPLADATSDSIPSRSLRTTSDGPASFAHAQARVEEALQSHLVGRVEHIGSTAVSGLAAKPIIDMLALIQDYDAGCARASAQAQHPLDPGEARVEPVG